MIKLTKQQWKIVTDVVDSFLFYPKMQIEEYTQNKDYNYSKKTCCSYERALKLRELVDKTKESE